MLLKCKNLKAVLTLTKNINFSYVEACGYDIISKRICFVIRLDTTVICIYKHSLDKLHVTGISCASDISSIEKFVQKVLRDRAVSSKINSSLFTCKLNQNIDLKQIIKKVEEEDMYTCCYNSEIFSALFLKPTNNVKQLGFPTILIFRNSTYIMIGASCLRIVKKCNILVKTLIKFAHT